MSNPQIKILSLSTDGVDIVVPLLAASAYKPLRYLSKDLGAGLTDFWFHSIAHLMRSPAAQGYLAVQDDALLGLLVISDNPWETNLFGKKAVVINSFVVDASIPNGLEVALALLDYALSSATTNGVGFMLGKTYTDDLTAIHALEMRGFILTDTVVDCYYDYRRVPFANITPPVLPENVILRPATPADRDELVAVAGLAFGKHFGRFHADERIGHNLATQAYEQWMHSSLDGYADWIHLALTAGKIVGFSIWKRPSQVESQLRVRVGHYSIAGIHPDYHGQGLFTMLTYAGMQSLDGIADIVEGPTHVNNYGVQMGYSKMGWRVLCDARHSFHKWINE